MKKKYEVLVCSSREELVKKMDSYLNDGWEPVGGICVTQVHDEQKKPYALFAQAIRKG